jgi:hypothetical protein
MLSDLSYGVESGVPDDLPVFIAESIFVHRGFGQTRIARSSPKTMDTSNSSNAASDSAAPTIGQWYRFALKPDERGASIDQRQHPEFLRGDLFGRPR